MAASSKKSTAAKNAPSTEAEALERSYRPLPEIVAALSDDEQERVIESISRARSVALLLAENTNSDTVASDAAEVCANLCYDALVLLGAKGAA